MAPCPECGKRLPGEPERYGARCPACRAPLYDQPPRRRRDDDGSRCAVHPENPALGTCGRCGNYLCDTCRTRWRDRWLCSACVDLVLERKDVVPAEARAHLRQALLALTLGLLSWVLLLAGLLVVAAAQVGGGNVLLILPAVVLVLGSPAPSVIGLGQGMAAIRARGDHMILATLGLVLCGLNVGVMIGMLSFGVSVNM
jgi:hypothetical protein